MTATPIPRTLALTLYGDLDVSVIDEMPPGRRPVRTFVREESKRRDIYAFLREEMRAGRQVYVVYPLVEESEVVRPPGRDRDGSAQLAAEVFPEFARGPPARPDGRGGEGPGDGGVPRRARPAPGLDDRDRGGHRRAERVRHARGARRALRAVPAPPAPRPRGPWPVEELLHPDEPRRRTSDARAPARRHGRDERRVPDRRGGPVAPRARATSSARASPACPRSASPTSCATRRCSRRRARRRSSWWPPTRTCVAPEHRALRAALLARWRGKLDLASVG